MPSTSPSPSENPDSAPSMSPAVSLAELEQELSRLQRAIRLAIQTKLIKLAGRSMETIGQNREMVDAIARLLDSHGLRVRCSECGHPAILRISPRGKSTGVFVFDHTIAGRRTFHGGKSQMPELRLVNKPARRKPQPAKTPTGKRAKQKAS